MNAWYQRRFPRLAGYDYSRAGAYFVTAVTEKRVCVFGDGVTLNDAGHMIGGCWRSMPSRFADVGLDEFVVMPNHIHGIVTLSPRASGGLPTSLGAVIGAFKSLTTVEYSRGVAIGAWPGFRGRLWQRSYYEHVIRNEASLGRIRQYIAENPAAWALDVENPRASRV